jgi:hypothetical protein
MSMRPRVTAGLKRPPLMRKKTQALTARLNPNASEMYRSSAMVGDAPNAHSLQPWRATLAAAKAKKRNMKVPRNSPMNWIIGQQ